MLFIVHSIAYSHSTLSLFFVSSFGFFLLLSFFLFLLLLLFLCQFLRASHMYCVQYSHSECIMCFFVMYFQLFVRFYVDRYGHEFFGLIKSWYYKYLLCFLILLRLRLLRLEFELLYSIASIERLIEMAFVNLRFFLLFWIRKIIFGMIASTDCFYFLPMTISNVKLIPNLCPNTVINSNIWSYISAYCAGWY